jgi:CubicO group peptidase (beta-lactamase class C family)
MLKPRATLAALALALCTSSAPGTAKAQKVDPAVAGWDAAGLADAVAYVASQKSTGFVVIDRNRIIAEQNWPLGENAAAFKANFVHGTAPDGALLEDVASQQKSFIAILAGIAIDKGLLDLSKPVSFYARPGWSKAAPAQEAKITVRNLMEMNSGLKEDLGYETDPDVKFFYNTPAYAIMKRVLEGASKQPLDDLTREWLTAPVGMKDTSWRKRPGAFSDVGNPTGLVTTPRDIARMGQLVLDGGKAADGQRVISTRQLDLIFKPTKTNPSYGLLWWLNGGVYALAPGGNAPRSNGPLIPAAPKDLVAAQGAQDRKLYVVPSRQLIVVRTGQAAPDRDFNQQLWSRLMKAAPKQTN